LLKKCAPKASEINPHFSVILKVSTVRNEQGELWIDPTTAAEAGGQSTNAYFAASRFG
jgi:hypothetical protein